MIDFKEQVAQVLAKEIDALDQAETVLMHIRRGCGRQGLLGMSPKSYNPMGGTVPVIRPLLCTDRNYIRHYLKDIRHIPWDEDYRAPFGAVTASTCSTSVTAYDFREYNPFRFSAEYYDTHLGLYSYNFRSYNATSARFTARDMVDSSDSLLNLYVLCANNCMAVVDFLGLSQTESISSHSVALGPQFTHTLPLGDKLNNKFKISGSHHFSFSSSFDSQGSIVFEKKRCCDGPNAGQIVQDEKWEGTISGSLSFSVASEQFSVSKYGIEISYWYGAKGEISGSIIGSISGESNKCDNEPLIVKASLNGSITGSALVGGSASLKINNWISVSGGVYGGLLANASFGMEFERHGDGAWQLQSDHSNGSISGTVTVDAIFAQYTFEHTFMEW